MKDLLDDLRFPLFLDVFEKSKGRLPPLEFFKGWRLAQYIGKALKGMCILFSYFHGPVKQVPFQA